MTHANEYRLRATERVVESINASSTWVEAQDRLNRCDPNPEDEFSSQWLDRFLSN